MLARNKVIWLAIGMRVAGKSMYRISKCLEVPETTVRRWIKRYNTTSDFERKEGSGRPRKGDNRADRRLLRATKTYRRSSAASLKSMTDYPASLRTVYRRLNECGLRSRRLLPTPLLTMKHRKTRLQWAMRRCAWRERQWRRLIWTDESMFSLMYQSRRRVWRASSENDESMRTFGTLQHNGGSVHVWGAISWNGRSELVFLDGPINGEYYLNVLIGHALPILENTSIFQDDNAPAHRSLLVRQFHAHHGTKTLPWPPRSPDLNPIENLWAYLGRKVDERRPFSNTSQLKTALSEEWNRIPQEIIRHLIGSMSRRIHAVISSKGGPTKY